MKIIFYDDECSFCIWCICLILRWDKKKRFLFSPLGGIKFGEHFKKEETDSLILLEDKEIWKEAKAIFRILYLLEGWKKIFGVLYHLPGWMINPFYRLVANNRRLFRRFHPSPAILAEHQERFLP